MIDSEDQTLQNPRTAQTKNSANTPQPEIIFIIIIIIIITNIILLSLLNIHTQKPPRTSAARKM